MSAALPTALSLQVYCSAIGSLLHDLIELPVANYDLIGYFGIRIRKEKENSIVRIALFKKKRSGIPVQFVKYWKVNGSYVGIKLILGNFGNDTLVHSSVTLSEHAFIN